jgi:hypothetical protein
LKKKKLSSALLIVIMTVTLFAVAVSGNVSSTEDLVPTRVLIVGEGGYQFTNLNTYLNDAGYSATYIYGATTITTELLSDYDELWYMGSHASRNEGDYWITDSELAAITAFRDNGGGILIAGDHDSTTDPSPHPNQDYTEGCDRISIPLGLEFWGAMSTPGAGGLGVYTVNKVDHPIWNGVSSIIGHISESEMVVLDSEAVHIIGTNDDDYPVMAIRDEGCKGRVVFVSTFVMFMDYFDLVTTGDMGQLIHNLVDWLSEVTPCLTPVQIDIKPGSYPNSINLGSNGVIPVAILSTEDFDATQVDPGTVTLGGAGVAVKGKGTKLLASSEDVNGDNLLDLSLKILTENLEEGQFQDGSAILTGQTYEGDNIQGQDTVSIVPS